VKTRIPTAKERLERRREAAKRSALRALKRARKTAEETGADLSQWEDEFLGSVETRVEKFGRAFRDPEKGGPAASLSILQSVKLKEIAGKAKGNKNGKKKEWNRRPK